MVNKSPYGDVHIPDDVSLAEFILQNAQANTIKDALVDSSTGETLSYKELVQGSYKLSQSLKSQGLQPGDVVLVCSPNSCQYPIVVLGCLLCGGVVSPVNPVSTAEELTQQMKRCKARFAFVDEPQTQKLEAVIQAVPSLQKIIVIGKSDSHLTLSKLTESEITDGVPDLSVPHINPRTDVAVILYSSGTTGLPKGVMLTHYNLIANICQHSHAAILPISITQEVAVGLPPMYHSYGMCLVMMLALYRGAKLVLVQRFSVEAFLKAVLQYRATRLYVAPPVLVALSKSPLAHRYKYPHVTDIWCGGAPFPDGVMQEFGALGMRGLRQGYGMTEASPGLTVQPYGQQQKNSIGYPLPNTEGKVIDVSTGIELGPMEDGELCFRGPQVMKGYLNNPEATAETVDQDGWLHTGDIGHFDHQGCFFIVDRQKELIKYKGYQVAPAELESLLLSCPCVQGACVVGQPDLTVGELPVAFIHLKPGHTETIARDILNFVKVKVAPYKKLRAVYFVDDIPKSATGKILRRVLKEKLKSMITSKL